MEGKVRVANSGAGPGPVGEAPIGDVIARFEGGRWFAWPRERFVWTAPRAGELALALNGRSAHGIEGAVEVVMIRLGPLGSPARVAFEPPTITLDRVSGGVRARYADRAGFGLDSKSLRFTLTTAHGGLFHLGSWVTGGKRETVLPLPPPGVSLPAGVHKLTGTITDQVGNDAPPATLTFDAVQ